MSDKEILEKAIQKAEENGYNRNSINDYEVWYLPDYLYVRLLFSEDFAKSFWGEEKIPFKTPHKWYWKEHLKEMVLEEEPLKYLEKFLDE